jgi:flagellar basal-body rod protein FlgC
MSESTIFPAIAIASTGLRAERQRMEVAANNLANAHATRGQNGELYQRQVVLFSAAYGRARNDDAQDLEGVRVDGVVPDKRTPLNVYAPYHPKADENGMVEQANVSTIEEMLDMISASRAYQANLSALQQSRDLARQTINLGKPS